MANTTRKGNLSNAIGDHGEHVAMTSFSRSIGGRYNRPLFRATPLEKKYPAADFLVDILDESLESLGFFFVQVKTNSTAETHSRTLRIRNALNKYNSLARIPIPTYLVGVDARSEKAYIVAANRPLKRNFSSMTKNFDLSSDTIRLKLYHEVFDYWQQKRNRVNKILTEFKNER